MYIHIDIDIPSGTFPWLPRKILKRVLREFSSWDMRRCCNSSLTLEESREIAWKDYIRAFTYGKWSIYRWFTYEKMVIFYGHVKLPESSHLNLTPKTGRFLVHRCHMLPMAKWSQIDQFYSPLSDQIISINFNYPKQNSISYINSIDQHEITTRSPWNHPFNHHWNTMKSQSPWNPMYILWKSTISKSPFFNDHFSITIEKTAHHRPHPITHHRTGRHPDGPGDRLEVEVAPRVVPSCRSRSSWVQRTNPWWCSSSNFVISWEIHGTYWRFHGTGSYIMGISWDFSGDFMRFEWWFHGIKLVIVHQKNWILWNVFQYLMYMFISQVDAHHLGFCVGLMNGEFNELVRGWNSPCIWVYMSGLVPQRYLKQLGQMDVYSQKKTKS